MSCYTFLNTIGENIRAARKKNHTKGEILGKAVGLSKAAISQIENGKVDITISTLYKIAEVLNVDVCSLIASERFCCPKQSEDLDKRDLLHRLNSFLREFQHTKNIA